MNDLTRHHHDYPQNQTTKEPAMNHLLTAIETDLTAAGHTIDQAIHDVLTRHLTLAGTAAHLAAEIAALTSNPLIGQLETVAGLTPAAQQAVAQITAQAAAALKAIGTAVQPAAA